MDAIKLTFVHALFSAKIFLYKALFMIFSINEDALPTGERVFKFFQVAAFVSPFTFVVATLTSWYMTNQGFTIAVCIVVFLNMCLGAWMHWQCGRFCIKQLLDKTWKMIFSIGMTYLTLEMVIQHGGSNLVTNSMSAALQVSTLLYPVSKIAKNIFILTNGEYPYPWIMRKLYNFKENGDLAQLMNAAHATPPAQPDFMNQPNPENNEEPERY